MFYAYVIQSSIDPTYFYKGHCQDLNKRLAQHNSGMTTSIRSKIPFILVYFEEFTNLDDAIKREKYFKTAAGRRFLKNKLAP
jgi:putative endonuclease